MHCPHCQFDHPASVNFCGMCGGRLVPECSHCGAENPLEFHFCGQCGYRLVAPEGAEGAPAAPDPRVARPHGAPPEADTSDAARPDVLRPDFSRPAASPTPVSPAPGTPPTAPAEPGPGGKRANPTSRAASPVTYTPQHLADQVLASRAALEGERKQVTVLFCDIVNSTATADSVGAETMHTLLNQFFELALTEVHRFEGTINQFLGDGFMALFGAPIAHEDHARRAVLAALALRDRIQERREELEREHGTALQVRMGLNTGMVVVGGIGDNLRMDYTAVGDTTNLAARLQGLAEPGTVLVSEPTYRLVLPFVKVEPLEPTKVKGKSEPIQPYKVISSRSRRASSPVRSRAPFVGRERELAALQDLWGQAREGHGQVVGIAGEAGSGKSRLVHELLHRLDPREATRLRGRCLSYGSGISYLPLAHMLRHAGGIADSDPPDTVREKLTRNLEQLGLDSDEHRPYLLRVLDVEDPSDDLAGVEPQVIHRRTFASLGKVLFRASELRPVILEIEDLHWIDATSEQVLERLVEGLAGARLLLLLTYRSGYQPGWMEKTYATQIPMRRLSREESRAMVAALLQSVGGGAAAGDFPDRLTDEILGKAEGNPFFLEELARSISGPQDDSGAPLPDTVPDTVQGLIMARLDRLPEEHKRVLQTASVLGREFPLDLLRAIWLDAAPLDPPLVDLKRWELFYEDPTSDPVVCSFHHALTQEVAYQTLLTGRRQSLHRLAGEGLERLYEGRLEDALDRLAYHYPLANEPAKAVTYLSRAAEKAARGYSHAEAAQALRQALEQARKLPDDVRSRRLVELTLQLVESLLPLARLPETLEVLEEHRELLDEVDGDRDTLAGRYHFWLGHTHSYLGHPEKAEAHARQSLEAAEAAGDAVTSGQARYVLCRDGFWIGKFSEGLAHGLKALDLLEGERWWQGQTYWVNGFHHFVLGRFQQALESMEQAGEIGEDLADPRLDTSWSTGYFLAAMGDWDGGIAACRGGLERARDPLNTAAALGFLGYAYLEKGDQEQAIPTLEQAVDKLEKAGMQQLFGWFSIYLGEAYLAVGRAEEARERAQEGLEVTEAARFLFGAALGVRALGRIALGTADLAEAETQLREARDRFEQLEASFEQARTQLDLARLAQALQQPDRAASYLEQARQRFQDLDATHHLAETDRLADELQAPTPVAPAAPTG